MSAGTTAVLVPVKAFDDAKVRLAPALDTTQRARLARQMATRVVEATGAMPVFIVCDSPEVADWARSVDAHVIWCPARGLNQAVMEGVDHLRLAGYDRAAVVHADLPYAEDLTWLDGTEGITLVPDRREDGTNVICLPVDVGFRFAYGPGSFARHVNEAIRLGTQPRIEHIHSLGWDIDTPADLHAPPTAVTDDPAALSGYLLS